MIDIVNLTNINYIEAIEESIRIIEEKYKGLTKELTCKVYSGLIKEELNKKHIISRIVSTSDFGIEYDHYFVLVKEKEKHYIIDLTYEQFFKAIPNDFKDLLTKGYIEADNNILKEYIKSFTNIEIDNNIENIIYKPLK